MDSVAHWAVAKHGQCWQTENYCLQCYSLSHGKVWTLFIEPWPSIHRLCYAGLWISRDSFVPLVMVKHRQVDIKVESEKSPYSKSGTANCYLLLLFANFFCFVLFLLLHICDNGARVRVAAAEILAPLLRNSELCASFSTVARPPGTAGMHVQQVRKQSKYHLYQA